MPADLSRVPHVNRHPAPWEPPTPKESEARVLSRRDRFLWRWWWCAPAAAIIALVAVGAFFDAHPKPAGPIPDVGQLIQAAAAYSANQADSNGLTVTRARVVSERLLPDGRAVVRLEVWTDGGTANHFVEWVTLKRHLWIGQSYRLCAVQPGHVCR